MTELLAVKDLHVRYGRIEVVHGVSFEVHPHEVVGLVGANGAGKTTIMRALAGQRDKTGSVALRGREIGGLPPHKVTAAGIALVPEGRMLFPSLTVTRNLQMGAYVHREPWTRDSLDRVLELFPALEKHLDRPAGVLSGGEQQMVAVGRALMARPSLLVLDEPSQGLAPLVVQRIYDAIRILKDSGTAILLAEQNATMALATVNRVYVIQTGEIVEQGTAESLRESPRIAEIYLGTAIDHGIARPRAGESLGPVTRDDASYADRSVSLEGTS